MKRNCRRNYTLRCGNRKADTRLNDSGIKQ